LSAIRQQRFMMVCNARLAKDMCFVNDKVLAYLAESVISHNGSMTPVERVQQYASTALPAAAGS
jgi:hypothetical protein